MHFVEVKTKADWRQFHRVPEAVYGAYPMYISPLESDIEKTFHPATNKTFQYGAARLFVLVDDDNHPVGRIAAFVDRQRNLQQDFPVGGIGFFECINNPAYAGALLGKAEQYLVEEEGVKAIDGPVNFGDRNKFWGLLVKGYEFPPLYQENYHPPYYRSFFEANGYQAFEQILTFKGTVKDIPLDRFKRVANRMRQRYGLTTRFLEKERMEWYADQLRQVYNEAFRQFVHFKPLHTSQILEIMRQAGPVLDPEMVCFAFEGDQPVGFMALLPDINAFLKPFNGHFGWLQLPSFIWRFRNASQLIAKGIASGIHPDFQRKGVFPLLVDHLASNRNIHKYSQIMLATIRGHNRIMVETVSNLGVRPDREHLAFRKMLDTNLPFEPFEFLEI